MKLARIILPERDNDNGMLTDEHGYLQKTLLERYGGFTQTSGIGGWKHEGVIMYERVRIYDVAMERADVISLRNLAAEMATRANQHSVMIVTPNGDVEFVKGI